VEFATFRDRDERFFCIVYRRRQDSPPRSSLAVTEAGSTLRIYSILINGELKELARAIHPFSSMFN